MTTPEAPGEMGRGTAGRMGRGRGITAEEIGKGMVTGGVMTSEGNEGAAQQGETGTETKEAAIVTSRSRMSTATATGDAETGAEAREMTNGGEIRREIATGTTATMIDDRSEMRIAEVVEEGKTTTTDGHTGVTRATATTEETTDRTIEIVSGEACPSSSCPVLF